MELCAETSRKAVSSIGPFRRSQGLMETLEEPIGRKLKLNHGIHIVSVLGLFQEQ